jgi:hypothetical protein
MTAIKNNDDVSRGYDLASILARESLTYSSSSQAEISSEYSRDDGCPIADLHPTPASLRRLEFEF